MRGLRYRPLNDFKPSLDLCLASPYWFSSLRDPSVQTNRKISCYFIIRIYILLLLFYNFILFWFQDLSLWHAVVDWLDLIPGQALGDMMAKHFFPRWLQVNCHLHTLLGLSSNLPPFSFWGKMHFFLAIFLRMLVVPSFKIVKKSFKNLREDTL